MWDSSQMWAAQFFGCTEPRHFLTSGGLGTMGYGLPAAIGAKLACPDKEVVLITGGRKHYDELPGAGDDGGQRH